MEAGAGGAHQHSTENWTTILKKQWVRIHRILFVKLYTNYINAFKKKPKKRYDKNKCGELQGA